MAITPYRTATDPFSPILEDFLRPAGIWGGRMGGMLRSPEADVIESENHIRVLVELPGMQADDIEVDLENNVLTISGEKKEEGEQEHDTWHLSERRYGKFSRSFVLPRDVESEQIEANFSEGVLTVTIPKSEKSRRRRIEIHDRGQSHRIEAETEQ